MKTNDELREEIVRIYNLFITDQISIPQAQVCCTVFGRIMTSARDQMSYNRSMGEKRKKIAFYENKKQKGES